MTLSEIAVCLEKPGVKPPGGRHASDEEIAAYADLCRRLGPLEKLRLAREGRF